MNPRGLRQRYAYRVTAYTHGEPGMLPVWRWTLGAARAVARRAMSTAGLDDPAAWFAREAFVVERVRVTPEMALFAEGKADAIALYDLPEDDFVPVELWTLEPTP